MFRAKERERKRRYSSGGGYKGKKGRASKTLFRKHPRNSSGGHCPKFSPPQAG
jgi:hypothetical protein